MVAITFGLSESKSRSEFWSQMISYKLYLDIIKESVCIVYKNIKNLYNHYKNLPQ